MGQDIWEAGEKAEERKREVERLKGALHGYCDRVWK